MEPFDPVAEPVFPDGQKAEAPITVPDNDDESPHQSADRGR